MLKLTPKVKYYSLAITVFTISGIVSNLREDWYLFMPGISFGTALAFMLIYTSKERFLNLAMASLFVVPVIYLCVEFYMYVGIFLETTFRKLQLYQKITALITGEEDLMIALHCAFCGSVLLACFYRFSGLSNRSGWFVILLGTTAGIFFIIPITNAPDLPQILQTYPFIIWQCTVGCLILSGLPTDNNKA